jgi:SRSO17 transposase
MGLPRTRQYCGELGKQDNCQVAVTLSIANHDAGLPVAYRLYLPKVWASDRKRRRKVGVPDEISFKTTGCRRHSSSPMP